MKNLNDEFRNKFNDFEEFMKNKFHQKFTDNFIEENTLLQDNQEFWKACVCLRNIYSHSNGIKVADITQETYDKFCREVEKIIRPRCASDISIKNVYKVNQHEKISDVISTIIEKNYTCCPVVDESDVVIGVFSSDSIMRYLKNESNDISNLHISDLITYCPQRGNREISFGYIKETEPEFELRKLFKNAYNKNKRLEALFVTEKGKTNGKLKGIITHWDLS